VFGIPIDKWYASQRQPFYTSLRRVRLDSGASIYTFLSEIRWRRWHRALWPVMRNQWRGSDYFRFRIRQPFRYERSIEGRSARISRKACQLWNTAR